MSITVRGTIYRDPEVYLNRAGDMTVYLNVLLQNKGDPTSKGRHLDDSLVHVVVATDPLAEHASKDIRKGTEVTITAHRIQVEDWHSTGPRAVVMADDIQIAPRTTGNLQGVIDLS